MIKNISAYKTIRTLLTICSLLLLCTALTACGKTGNPRPREASRSFVWQSAEAVPVKNCIAIHAVMSGECLVFTLI
ncbi:hypothetical protein LJB93_02560 [Desulfovibrio sp. OttesenSCG-928-F07]|nr:hypothetical protein [Desulfovibrio sp. OttesenSCG-928-F07]